VRPGISEIYKTFQEWGIPIVQSAQELNAMATKIKEVVKMEEDDIAGCRQSAQGALCDLQERAARPHRGLKVLLKVIPWDLLSKEDEKILYDYFAAI